MLLCYSDRPLLFPECPGIVVAGLKGEESYLSGMIYPMPGELHECFPYGAEGALPFYLSADIRYVCSPGNDCVLSHIAHETDEFVGASQ